MNNKKILSEIMLKEEDKKTFKHFSTFLVLNFVEIISLHFGILMYNINKNFIHQYFTFILILNYLAIVWFY